MLVENVYAIVGKSQKKNHQTVKSGGKKSVKMQRDYFLSCLCISAHVRSYS